MRIGTRVRWSPQRGPDFDGRGYQGKLLKRRERHGLVKWDLFGTSWILLDAIKEVDRE